MPDPSGNPFLSEVVDDQGGTIVYDPVLNAGKGGIRATTTGAALTPSNKNMVGAVTTADNDLACVVPLVLQPKPGAYVGVWVNNIEALVGSATKAGVECYFSGDGGATARTQGGVQIGDLLYWVGSVAGYELDAVDRLSFNYEV